MAKDSPVLPTVRFRITLRGNSRFVLDDLEEKLHGVALQHFKKMGIRAELLPPPMKGSGFDLTLWVRLVMLLVKGFGFLRNLLLSSIRQAFDDTAPYLLLEAYYTVDDGPFYVDDQLSGAAQAELLHALWLVKSHLETTHPLYRIVIESHVYYSYYRYSLLCMLYKQGSNDNDIRSLVHFVRGLKLKSYVSETITFDSSLLIKHAVAFSNIDDQHIHSKRYKYLKIDRAVNGSLRQRGLRTVEHVKGMRTLEIRPRFKRANI